MGLNAEAKSSEKVAGGALGAVGEVALVNLNQCAVDAPLAAGAAAATVFVEASRASGAGGVVRADCTPSGTAKAQVD